MISLQFCRKIEKCPKVKNKVLKVKNKSNLMENYKLATKISGGDQCAIKKFSNVGRILKLVYLKNENELLGSLHDMVIKYETSDSPYNLQELDPQFLTGMSKGVQGFKIKINKLEGKAKLSQNHSVQRQELVINQLEQIPRTSKQQISSFMKANQKSNCFLVLKRIREADKSLLPLSHLILDYLSLAFACKHLYSCLMHVFHS